LPTIRRGSVRHEKHGDAAGCLVRHPPERANITGYAVFSGTHTGEGGPPPTGKRTSSDYVYSMDFDGDKIRHMTKIWNAGWAMKELGWACARQ